MKFWTSSIFFFLVSCSVFVAPMVVAQSKDVLPVESTHQGYFPIYAGPILGYGFTTWGDLVDQEIDIATPERVNENGFLYGAVLGYEFARTFSVEGQYFRFPTAHIYFDEWSDYAFNDNVKYMTSRTHVLSLLAKFQAPFFKTHFKPFAGVGFAQINRKDVLTKVRRRWTAEFSGGLHYDISRDFTSEVAFVFFPGSGKAENDPVYHYVPFLYGVFAMIAYRIPISAPRG